MLIFHPEFLVSESEVEVEHETENNRLIYQSVLLGTCFMSYVLEMVLSFVYGVQTDMF